MRSEKVKSKIESILFANDLLPFIDKNDKEKKIPVATENIAKVDRILMPSMF